MTSRGTLLVYLAAALPLVACGGKAKPPPPPKEPVVVKKPPPPPPPPVCVPPLEPAMVGMANADAALANFCVSDGAEQSACFAVDLDEKKYGKLDESPVAQTPTLAAPTAKVQLAGATEVQVCFAEGGAECKTLKPKVPKGATAPIDAAIDATGARAVLMLGDAEKGKGVAEVWDVAKGKKTATIKYAKGDHKCGTAQVLGDVIYISASVCAGPAAKGALYSMKGKKLADVGGKDFGTYGATAVQVTETQWAFLEEGAGVIALQDVKTGKVDKTIDLLALWGSDRGGGNPGESALVRGGDGKLVVIAGSPVAGSIGVVDIASGETTVIQSLPCEATEKPAAETPAEGATDEK